MTDVAKAELSRRVGSALSHPVTLHERRVIVAAAVRADVWGELDEEVRRLIGRVEGRAGDEGGSITAAGPRYVRTPAGERKYGQQIGSLIVPDVIPVRPSGQQPTAPDLGKLTVPALRALAKQRGVKLPTVKTLGRSVKRADIVAALGGAESDETNVADRSGLPGIGPAAKVAPKAGRPPATPVRIHDLFDADDATIEAALKDVYEGQFGPYTTKVKVYITRAGTRTDGRGRERKVEPLIGVEGKIYDAQGLEIGHFGRSIGPSNQHYGDVARREVWASHQVVELGFGDDDESPTKYHGKGFGGAFNRRAIDWYRASGVHGISQNANNFYVWASQGFNFAGGVMPEYLAERMRELIADLRAGRTKNKFGDTIPKRLREAPDLDVQIAEAEALLARWESTKPGEPGYPTAYEVSQLGRRKGQRGKTALWLGKHLPVAADEMILNPDEGEVISQ